jgi:histidine triad (HIT) family protein
MYAHFHPMENCIFCKILRKEIPGSLAYEDEAVIALIDIHPINTGHLLVIPKAHCSQVSEVPDEIAGRMFQVGKNLLKAMKKLKNVDGFRCTGGNLFISEGAEAGQEVMHAHLHVVPRYAGDGQKIGFKHGSGNATNRALIADHLLAEMKAFTG